MTMTKSEHVMTILHNPEASEYMLEAKLNLASARITFHLTRAVSVTSSTKPATKAETVVSL